MTTSPDEVTSGDDDEEEEEASLLEEFVEMEAVERRNLRLDESRMHSTPIGRYPSSLLFSLLLLSSAIVACIWIRRAPVAVRHSSLVTAASAREATVLFRRLLEQPSQTPPAHIPRRQQQRRRGNWTSVAVPVNSDPCMTFHLHPTAALSVEVERRKLLSTDDAEDDDGRSANLSHPHHADWFAPERNAVYATIPDPADPAHAENIALRDFHAHRHWSRYERHHRSSRGRPLVLNWNGAYDDAFFALLPLKTIGEGHPGPSYTSANNSTTRIHDGARRRTEQTKSLLPKAKASAVGIFNNYQAVPLSQGYGTHFANVWVGTPTPQRKTVIVDTGSHYTAFPCAGCTNCGAPHHTDPYFRPERSETFHQLQCDECQDGVACDGGKCKFNQAYTEGSSWDAVQVKDQFYCGGTDVLDSASPIDRKYAIEFMFGCQASMTGLFVTQLADGIMGMSAHPATLPKKLYDERRIEHNMFAMCYRRELGTSKRGVTAGSMTFGGVSNNMDTSPFVFAKNVAKIGWFTVYVKNIYVRSGGGQSAKSIDPIHRTIKVRVNVKALNSGKGVIVDSGTTDT